MNHIVVMVAGVAIGLAVLAFVSLFENNTPNRPHSQRPRRPPSPPRRSSRTESPPPRASRSESPRLNLRQRQTSNSNHMPNSTSVTSSRASSNLQNEPVVPRSSHSSSPSTSRSPSPIHSRRSHSAGPRSLDNCPVSTLTRCSNRHRDSPYPYRKSSQRSLPYCRFQAQYCHSCKENDLVTFMPCEGSYFCDTCALNYVERNEFCAICEHRIDSMN